MTWSEPVRRLMRTVGLVGRRLAGRPAVASVPDDAFVLYEDRRTGKIRAVSSEGDRAIEGAGAGTLNHAALTSNLAWTSSGHTGTASGVPAFGSGGAAQTIAPPTSGSRTGKVLQWTDNSTLGWVWLAVALATAPESAIESAGGAVSPITSDAGTVA